MWIELDGWQAKLRFSACHFIPNHPTCGYLHGHTYAISVRVTGTQYEDFVMDFEELKRYVTEICESLDHRILLASEDDDIQITTVDKRHVSVFIERQAKRYIFPIEDVVMLPLHSASAEDLCLYILDQLCRKISADNITEIYVRLDEGLGQGAGCKRTFNSALSDT